MKYNRWNSFRQGEPSFVLEVSENSIPGRNHTKRKEQNANSGGAKQMGIAEFLKILETIFTE